MYRYLQFLYRNLSSLVVFFFPAWYYVLEFLTDTTERRRDDESYSELQHKRAEYTVKKDRSTHILYYAP